VRHVSPKAIEGSVNTPVRVHEDQAKGFDRGFSSGSLRVTCSVVSHDHDGSVSEPSTVDVGTPVCQDIFGGKARMRRMAAAFLDAHDSRSLGRASSAERNSDSTQVGTDLKNWPG